MSQSPTDRPYIQAWLKRVERQLRGSGHISQLAFSLSNHHGSTPDEWSRRLRDILSGEQNPSADLIAIIDRLLSKPVEGCSESEESQQRLF